MSGISKDDILGVIRSVIKKWTKQRKAEERGRSRSLRKYTYSDRVNFTEVLDDVLPGAYEHASGPKGLPVAKRQMYYASRQKLLDLTGRKVTADYFSQTLLVQYMSNNPEKTASWKITADPRGSLIIPNAAHEIIIPCGTLQIDGHLRNTSLPINPLDVDAYVDIEWPSKAGSQRFQGVLYIEKEGFGPILKAARIAERFDLAVLSCKGQSVVAARKFVDMVCYKGSGVPLFVAHDLDKAGFEIEARLTKVSHYARQKGVVKYEFINEIDKTDLGLRLADVEQYQLDHEDFDFSGQFAEDLGCTTEEKEYLRSGRRVELNAFTSPQLVEWLETKLTEQGLDKRLVPSNDVLYDAYRRAIVVATINGTIDEAMNEAVQKAKDAKVPKTFQRKLLAAMKNSDEPWDQVLYRLVSKKVKNRD